MRTTPSYSLARRCQGCGGYATHRWRSFGGQKRHLQPGRPVCMLCIELWKRYGRTCDVINEIGLDENHVTRGVRRLIVDLPELDR